MALAAACGSSEYVPPVAPPPRTPASIAPAESTPLHGFDPRPYYGKRPLSVQRGAASYYHDRFAGRLTANGERYDPNAFTAAHRKLPFGTVLRVVHETTGDWVLVRVNDRGPYGPGKRIVDLSREAARRLAMLRDGVVRVRIEVLELGEGKYVRQRQVTRAETSR
ncbi:MAG: septal ring lytic transglycosylase RlpA family protein [Polyangiales bacterium]